MSQTYYQTMELENVVIQGYKVGDMTPDMALDKLKSVLGKTIDSIDHIRSHPEEYGLTSDRQIKFTELKDNSDEVPFK